MTSSIQEAYPIRQKGIHFINPSSSFDTIYKIFYNFMSSKIKKRVSIYGPRSKQNIIFNNFISLDFCA